MISLAALLLMAGASEVVTLPAITIDPCIAVDADEVRRLTALELSDWTGGTSLGALEVTVTCERGLQELRVTDRARGRIIVRGVDLSSSPGSEGEARARELALAIAELLRRADAETLAPPPASPVPAPQAAEIPPVPEPTPPRTTEVRPWRVELGVSGVGAVWTSGEALFGGDLTGRFRLARWLLADLRIGGRRTRPVDLGDGMLDGHGISARTGFAFDATPSTRGVGVSFGARLGVDWLRYAAVDDGGTTIGGGDAAAVSASGTTTAFVVLRAPFCLVIDAAVGGALHSIALRSDDQMISRAGGVLLSTAVGLGGQF